MSSIAELDLDLQSATDHRPLPERAEFERWVAVALQGRPQSVLTVRLVDEEESRQLNATYRDKDYATNVLSFPADLPEEIGIPLLGDVVICAPVVCREADEQGKSVRDHWAHLTIHGVLHLLGFDHQDEAEARVMEQEEIALLNSLGIANPYD